MYEKGRVVFEEGYEDEPYVLSLPLVVHLCGFLLLGVLVPD